MEKLAFDTSTLAPSPTELLRRAEERQADKPRRDRTMPPLDIGIEADQIPKLTAKQAKFVGNILAGMTMVDAYRKSRDTSRSSPVVIHNNAFREYHNPKINAYLRLARIATLGKHVATKEQHVGQLTRIRELALSQGDAKSAVSAEHLIGKVSGHYVERTELNIYDPAAILAQINASAPEVAQALARRFNAKLANVAPVEQLTIDGESS